MKQLILKFKLDIFEGPLDLLLYLVRKNEFDIFDIPIAEITYQYLEYLKFLEEIGIDTLADYMAMAAFLMEIKSRILVPAIKGENEEGGGEVIEEVRKELADMLITYQIFKRAGEILNSLPMLERDEFLRGYSGLKNEEVPIEDISPYELARKYREMLMRKEPLQIKVEEIDISEKVKEIREILAKEINTTFFRISDGKSRFEKALLFFALLEIIKDGMCYTRQEKIFSDIQIFSKTGDNGEKHKTHN